MKQKQTTRSVNLTIILASAFALVLPLIIVPTQVSAQVVCPGTTADSDGDGFTDAQECAVGGITWSTENVFGGAPSSLP